MWKIYFHAEPNWDFAFKQIVFENKLNEINYHILDNLEYTLTFLVWAGSGSRTEISDFANEIVGLSSVFVMVTLVSIMVPSCAG